MAVNVKYSLITKLLCLMQTVAAIIAAFTSAHTCHASVNNLDKRQRTDKGGDRLKQSKQPDIFAVYLFDPRKYNDLSIRAVVLQRQQELHPSAPSYARDAAYKRLALEYVRRISGGYTSDTVRSAQHEQSSDQERPSKRRLISEDDAFRSGLEAIGKVGYNMLIAYQPFVISNAMEGRLRYDLSSNSVGSGFALGALGQPHTLVEVRYFITEQPFIPPIPREYLANAMELVDQFSPMDRSTITTTHRLDKAGLTGRARYAMNQGVISYGVSKTISGPLVVHILKENDISGNSKKNRSGITAMVSYAARF
jgi:hypothetical protein